MLTLRLSLFLIVAFAAVLAAAPVESAPGKILFASMAPTRTGVFLADAEGRNEHALMPATGLDYDASFSTDGKWIVFTSERAGSADIYRIHPDGSGLERLTADPSFDDQGALSPDGRTLAFVSTRRGGTANIWLMDLATRRVRNLTHSGSGNFRPSWSPDGKWIAFSSDRDEPHRRQTPSWELLHFTAIYIVRPNGSALRRMTDPAEFDRTPIWPAAGKLVYSQQPDLKTPRKTILLDISTGRQSAYAAVRSGPKDGYDPSWSPNGKTVVYTKVIRPYKYAASRVIRVFSRDPRFQLFRTGVSPTPSPDGTHILLAGGLGNGTNNLKIMDSDGSHLHTLYSAQQGMWLVSPSWSPNGTTIAFSIGAFFARPVKPGQIASIDADGSHLRLLTHGDVSSGFPSFSPDGQHLVYRVLGNAEPGLRIMNLRDGSIRKLTDHWNNFPAWSPRGDLIAFTSFRTGDFEIYTIRPDGTDLRQLTHDHGNDAHPSWSPNGQWILFSSSRMGWKDEGSGDDQSYGEIFAMHADGTDVRQLTDDKWEEATEAWLPELPDR